jgi:hypothetical protein
MGGTLGGIGDIIAATSYKRPKLPEPGGQEKRLRTLAQAQLIGGGQQLLGGQALYNQLAPVLLGQLPGMTIRPTGGGGAGAGGEGTTAAGGAAAGGPGMADYQEALANYQAAVGRQQRLTSVEAQLKATKKGPEKRALRQERKTLKKQQKGSPTVPQLERQLYQAGSSPAPVSVSMGTGDTGGLGGFGTAASPSLRSSLAEIMGFLKGSGDQGGPIPDFAGRFRTGFEAATPQSSFRVSGWGQGNPRGDQDVTPGGFDASVFQPVDPRMERVIPGVSPMELNPEQQVERTLGILRPLPRAI